MSGAHERRVSTEEGSRVVMGKMNIAWAIGAYHMLLLAFTSALCDISSLHISMSPRRAQCIRGVLSLPRRCSVSM